MIHHATIATQWGPFICVTTDRGLVATFLPSEHSEPIDAIVARRWPDATPTRRTPAGLSRAIAAYFSGQSTTFDVTLDLTGVTEFRQSVLEACRRIPYGQTASNSDLAREIGQPLASRAVGSAMANNPLPLIIPCHRVVRQDGSLGGFSSPDGVSMKLRLLRLEGVSITRRRAG